MAFLYGDKSREPQLPLVPECYDTRELFRAQFAASYDCAHDLQQLIGQLNRELEWVGVKLKTREQPLTNDLGRLRELALNLEHTLYAIYELQLAARFAVQ